MRVLVFGDSIAQGFYDEGGGWVNRLRWQYDKTAVDNNDLDQPTVFNLGVSGDRSEHVAARIESEIVARSRSDDRVVVVAVGTNDSIYVGDKHESEPETYRQNLATILDIAKGHSSKVLFVGLLPVVDKLVQPCPWSAEGKSYSTERIKLFDQVLNDFCVENGVSLVSVWDDFESNPDKESLFFDGLHPNGTGHQLIADIVKPKLEELLV